MQFQLNLWFRFSKPHRNFQPILNNILPERELTNADMDNLFLTRYSVLYIDVRPRYHYSSVEIILSKMMFSLRNLSSRKYNWDQIYT